MSAAMLDYEIAEDAKQTAIRILTHAHAQATKAMALTHLRHALDYIRDPENYRPLPRVSVQHKFIRLTGKVTHPPLESAHPYVKYWKMRHWGA
jgi:hypothetical protein